MANSIPIHQRQDLNSDFQSSEILPEFVMLTGDKIEQKKTHYRAMILLDQMEGIKGSGEIFS